MTPETFRRVVDEHSDRLFGYAAWMLRDREEAREVVQEAFVRLWNHRAKVDEGPAARAWLLRTAHNLCLDTLRRGSRRPETALEALPPLAVPASTAPGPDREAHSGELREGIARALRELGERDRAILVMREIQALPYEEIASALGMPLGTLKATLHRARGRLREKLVAAGMRP